MSRARKSDADLWRDPVFFVSSVLRNPETGKRFELFPAEIAFLREALTPGPDGRLRYSELLFGAIKKSGKTMIAAWSVLFVIFALGGRFSEAYCVANDEEQAVSRVFRAIVRLIEMLPSLKDETKITERQILFTKTGATITALASDFAGAAGANPNIVVFDELWAYATERAQRLWDELIPVPTQKVSTRLTVSYAGFEGESTVLESLYKRGLQGAEIGPSLYRQDGMLMAWHRAPVAPWQTAEWIEQMRGQLRPQAFRRMILNEWVSGEEQFVPVSWWDAAATSQPIAADRSLPVYLGVDAGLKRDSAAVVAVTWDGGARKARVVSHRIFFPTKGEPLDIESTIEQAILSLAQRFDVRQCRYDPWQFARSAQTLAKANINMVEYPQSMPNLTAMSTNLFELLKGGNLLAYPDDNLRLAVQHAVAVEGSRGLKITKEKASHKIDVLVALAIAALAVVEKQPRPTVNIDPAAFAGLLTRSVHRPELARGGEYLGPNSTQPGAPSKWR